MFGKFFKLVVFAALIGAPAVVAAQGTSINLTGGTYDAALPVEVTAERLSVDQTSSTATFEGNALVAQGDLRLGAEVLRITYAPDNSGVSSVEAGGNVTFTNGSESASADTALYVVGDATITMTGDVTLVQGPNTISGDRLVLNLRNGTGAVEGNVKTVFTPKPQK